MQSHYRKSLVFSYENLDNAAVSYDKLIARIAALKAADGESIDDAAYEACRAKFTQAMDNDLNTSMAVTALYDVLKAKTNDTTKLALIEDFDRVLCLDLLAHAKALTEKEEAKKAAEAKALADAAAADPFVAEILQLIEERKAAKKAKNFAEADRIRDYLASKGVTLIDTAQGTTYKID
jgi:cysteinyl-tRNA synthetase